MRQGRVNSRKNNNLEILNLSNNEAHTPPLPEDFPEISWPTDVAYDNRRNYYSIISLGGEGHLYRYSPDKEMWIDFNSTKNFDINSIFYDKKMDRYVAWANFINRGSLVIFDGDGKLVSDGSKLIENIVALPNGKSIIAYNAFGNGHVYLRRLNNDGSVDNTFGVAGKATLQIANSSTEIKDMLVYNNQIYCCGTTNPGSNTYPFWARFSIDGILDNTFANGGINTNPQHYSYTSLIIEPSSGKILIGGMKDFDEIVVIRIHTNGYMDGNFGNFGEATFKTANVGEYYDTRHINIDKDNKIILAGKYHVTQGNTFSKNFIARLNSNGYKDFTFDADAIAYYNSAVGNFDEARRIFANSANDYYVIGATWKANQDWDYSLMKVKNNGVLDNSFDADGWKLYNIGGTSPEEYLLNGIAKFIQDCETLNLYGN